MHAPNLRVKARRVPSARSVVVPQDKIHDVSLAVEQAEQAHPQHYARFIYIPGCTAAAQWQAHRVMWRGALSAAPFCGDVPAHARQAKFSLHPAHTRCVIVPRGALDRCWISPALAPLIRGSPFFSWKRKTTNPSTNSFVATKNRNLRSRGILLSRAMLNPYYAICGATFLAFIPVPIRVAVLAGASGGILKCVLPPSSTSFCTRNPPRAISANPQIRYRGMGKDWFHEYKRYV